MTISFRPRKDKEPILEELLQACKDHGITMSQLFNAMLPALVNGVNNMQNNIINIQETVEII